MAAIELSVTGQKKVKTLMTEFNKRFPYLGLRLYVPEVLTKKKPDEPFTPYRVPVDVTLASVRAEGASGGTITITGNKKIRTLENEFQKVFGLYAQVCYRPQNLDVGVEGIVTLQNHDQYTLASFNEKCKQDGYEEFKYQF